MKDIWLFLFVCVLFYYSFLSKRSIGSSRCHRLSQCACPRSSFPLRNGISNFHIHEPHRSQQMPPSPPPKNNTTKETFIHRWKEMDAAVRSNEWEHEPEQEINLCAQFSRGLFPPVYKFPPWMEHIVEYKLISKRKRRNKIPSAIAIASTEWRRKRTKKENQRKVSCATR